MADEPNAATPENSEPQAQPPKSIGTKITPWLVTALVVVVCAAVGFIVSRVFGTSGKAQTTSAAQQAAPAEPATQEELPIGSRKGDNWYYDLEPIVANLNEPGVTRYVRVTLTLEISSAMKPDTGKTFFDPKRPLMKHWLTLYLSNQTVDNIRGERNLRLMQAQIADTLNQGLFPNAKGQIVRILFKELSIQ